MNTVATAAKLAALKKILVTSNLLYSKYSRVLMGIDNTANAKANLTNRFDIDI